MKTYKIFITFLVILLIFTSCSENTSNKNEFTNKQTDKITFFSLDTVITISLTKKVDDEILQNCKGIVNEIYEKMSPEINTSEVYKINENAGIKPVKVSELTFEVIEKSLKYSKLSSGNFDITIRPVIKAWGIGTDNPKIPDNNTLKQLVKKIDYKNIVIDDKKKTVFIKEKNCSIDLGGIAKGYCADKVADYLRQNKIENGILDFGGNIFALGKKEDKKLWKVGIKNPITADPSPFGYLEATNKTVVTSGIYERFFEKDGNVYHHILSTKDGKPINNDLVSVSVIGESSIDADALSTMLFTLGLNKGLDTANNIKDISAIFVTKDKKVYTTENFKGKFKILNKDFELELTI